MTTTFFTLSLQCVLVRTTACAARGSFVLAIRSKSILHIRKLASWLCGTASESAAARPELGPTTSLTCVPGSVSTLGRRGAAQSRAGEGERLRGRRLTRTPARRLLCEPAGDRGLRLRRRRSRPGSTGCGRRRDDYGLDEERGAGDRERRRRKTPLGLMIHADLLVRGPGRRWLEGLGRVRRRVSATGIASSRRQDPFSFICRTAMWRSRAAAAPSGCA